VLLPLALLTGRGRPLQAGATATGLAIIRELVKSSVSTPTLVVRAAKGDLGQRHEAFVQLVERFQGMVLGCAFASLGDMARAEDAAQEAWILAWQQLPQLRDPNAFGAWMRRLISTCCHRQTRQKSQSVLSFHEIDEEALEGELPSAEVARQVEANELRFLVRAAVMKLPPKQRVVMLLFYFGQNSQAEISEFLDVPLTTVKKRLHDARHRLRKELETMFEHALQHNASPDLAAQAKEVLLAFENASKERIHELLAQAEKTPGLLEEVMRQGQFQKFTGNARRAISFASDAAIEQGAKSVEPWHLLFGLRRIQGSLAAQILEEAAMPLSPFPTDLETLPLSSATEAVLHKAAAQALTLAERTGSRNIEAEHLLLALFEEEQEQPAQELKRLGLSSAFVQERIVNQSRPSTAPETGALEE